MKVLFLILSVGVFLHPASVQAWKIDLHVWVAQQVLNDARDGSVELDLGGRKISVELPEDRVASLRDHPVSYLLGSVGPDAFPGAASGQLVIHPAVPGGWGVSEWLQFLLNDPDLSSAERAFALGFTSHAASDIFAHTFINRYAGDVFELSEHPDAARRHIYLESFVSNYLPPVVDTETGRQFGSASAALRQSGDLPVPRDLVRRKFYMSPAAQEQYGKTPLVPHLVAAYDLHNTLTDITAEDGLIDDIELKIKTFIANYILETEFSEEEVAKAVEIQKKIHKLGNEAMGEVTVLLRDMAVLLDGIENDRIAFARKSADEALDLADRGLQLRAEVDRAALDKAKKFAELEEALLDVWGEVSKFCPPPIELPLVGEIKHPCEIKMGWVPNPNRGPAQDAFDIAQELLISKEAEERRVLAQAREAANAAADLAVAAQQARHVSHMAFFDLLERGWIGDPHDLKYNQWRDNIPEALVEWSVANAEAIVRSVDPAKPNALAPLDDWIKCYGPVFLAAPIEASSGFCEIRDSVATLRQAVTTFEDALLKFNPIMDVLVDERRALEADIEELKGKIEDAVVDDAFRRFDELTGANALAFYKGFTEPVSAESLDAIMSDPGPQGLVPVPDASARLISEMNVTNGHFDASRFNAVYNSVVLSKLALLDRQGLVALARAGGVRESVFGADLFAEGEAEADNILFGFIRSIDGNHAWMDLAPPHPRTDGYESRDFDLRAGVRDRNDPGYIRYGYTDYGLCQDAPRRWGMRLWADAGAREQLFDKLFHGKIAAGIDAPHEFPAGFAEVLPTTYPDIYQGTGAWAMDGEDLRHLMHVPDPVVFRITPDVRIASEGDRITPEGRFRPDLGVRVTESGYPAVIDGWAAGHVFDFALTENFADGAREPTQTVYAFINPAAMPIEGEISGAALGWEPSRYSATCLDLAVETGALAGQWEPTSREAYLEDVIRARHSLWDALAGEWAEPEEPVIAQDVSDFREVTTVSDWLKNHAVVAGGGDDTSPFSYSNKIGLGYGLQNSLENRRTTVTVGVQENQYCELSVSYHRRTAFDELASLGARDFPETFRVSLSDLSSGASAIRSNGELGPVRLHMSSRDGRPAIIRSFTESEIVEEFDCSFPQCLKIYQQNTPRQDETATAEIILAHFDAGLAKSADRAFRQAIEQCSRPAMPE